MNNVTFIQSPNVVTGVMIEYAIISWGNADFTSMTKAEYDKEYPNGVNEASTK